jgi:hypothetical protein
MKGEEEAQCERKFEVNVRVKWGNVEGLEGTLHVSGVSIVMSVAVQLQQSMLKCQ